MGENMIVADPSEASKMLLLNHRVHQEVAGVM